MICKYIHSINSINCQLHVLLFIHNTQAVNGFALYSIVATVFELSGIFNWSNINIIATFHKQNDCFISAYLIYSTVIIWYPFKESLYWIPKVLKCRYKQCYIAGSATLIHEISLQVIYNYSINTGLQGYCDTSYSRGSVNQIRCGN